MTTSPQDRGVGVHGLADETPMDTFTVRLPRWPVVRLFDRNPLIRTSDRVEALVLVLAVVVSLLAAPIAGTVGTAVHDSRRHLYAEQARTRHTVTATVTDSNAAHQVLRTTTITVPARWSAAGVEHTGVVKAHSAAKTGDLIEIWVDENDTQVDTPTPTTRAAIDAVTAALGIWLTVAAAAATLFAGTRAVCDRIRSSGWLRDIDNLVGRGDGHNATQP
jgi:hypothetical protein